ncbi:MAG: helix-turn-helix domain-containing protein [Turicibacter sp.]|nr:helix-turn-helix domain-containing protein [Turicibacter sp.]
MPFIEVDAREEEAMLEEMINTSPEARAAHEDFTREFEFRKKLVLVREEAGLTQKELEKLSRLDQRTISRIEINKEISPSVKTLMKYLGAMGYSLDIVKD